ncbi:unnamed protein product, partial [Onchocerca ochengi]
RSEEYIHLRDAVVNDGNTTNIGRLTILPSSYAGNPRHMHEYAQDAIAYIRQYGRSDLFITLTCNSAWEDIQNLLLPRQSTMDRHDNTARVFRQKLKSQMNFITKHEVFGSLDLKKSTKNGDKLAIMYMRNGDIEVDNRWVVPYSSVLLKEYKAHINAKYGSVLSIKYICKYVNKGNDMAIFGVQPEKSDRNAVLHIDEIAQYQTGRYISSNESVWRIFSFPIYERSPALVHLAVYLENGQRVYFSAENVQQIALNPPATTLTAFFALYHKNHLRKHCYIRKCLHITHGMRVANHLNDANEANQLTDKEAYSEKPR